MYYRVPSFNHLESGLRQPRYSPLARLVILISRKEISMRQGYSSRHMKVRTITRTIKYQMRAVKRVLGKCAEFLRCQSSWNRTGLAKPTVHQLPKFRKQARPPLQNTFPAATNSSISNKMKNGPMKNNCLPTSGSMSRHQ